MKTRRSARRGGLAWSMNQVTRARRRLNSRCRYISSICGRPLQAASARALDRTNERRETRGGDRAREPAEAHEQSYHARATHRLGRALGTTRVPLARAPRDTSSSSSSSSFLRIGPTNRGIVVALRIDRGRARSSFTERVFGVREYAPGDLPRRRRRARARFQKYARCPNDSDTEPRDLSENISRFARERIIPRCAGGEGVARTAARVQSVLTVGARSIDIQEPAGSRTFEGARGVASDGPAARRRKPVRAASLE